MKRKKRKMLITEFAIQVYSDRISWDGFDKFLWWLLTRKSNGGFLSHARKIQKFR